MLSNEHSAQKSSNHKNKMASARKNVICSQGVPCAINETTAHLVQKLTMLVAKSDPPISLDFDLVLPFFGVPKNKLYSTAMVAAMNGVLLGQGKTLVFLMQHRILLSPKSGRLGKENENCY